MAGYDMIDPREYRFEYSPTFQSPASDYNMQVPQGFRFTPQSSAAERPWIGQISGGLPIFSGMLSFIQGMQGAKEFSRQERLLKKQAQYAVRQAGEMAGAITHEGAEVKGSMLAAFGKSGTTLEGSPLLALADTETEIEKDIAQVIEQGRINYEALMWQARQAHRAASGSKWGAVAGLVGDWGKAIIGGG